jgi:hypothetical protein
MNLIEKFSDAHELPEHEILSTTITPIIPTTEVITSKKGMNKIYLNKWIDDVNVMA